METTYNLKKKIVDFFALTRWRYTFDFNLIITTLAYITTDTKIDLMYFVVLIANQLSIWFTFMINDVEDAEEDSTDPKKLKRNVISHKAISKEEGTIYTFFIGFISTLLYAFLSYEKQNFLILISGFLATLLGFLYSYRKVRLKAVPVIDLVSHAYMLAAGLFLPAYFASNPKYEITFIGVLGAIFVFTISMYGQLENEVRDIEIDKRENIKTLATILGKRVSQLLQVIIMTIAVGLAIYSLYLISPKLSWIVQSFVILFLVELAVVVMWVVNKKKYSLKDQIHRFLLITWMLNLFLLNLKIYIWE